MTASPRVRFWIPLIAGTVIGAQVVSASGVGAATAHRPAGASISTLALRTGDVTHLLGGTFRAFINGVISNQDLAAAEKTAGAASGPSAALKGRVTGWESVWMRGSRTSSLSVTNAISEYLNSSFPHSAFTLMRNYHPAHGKTFMTFTSYSGVGDEAAQVTMHSGSMIARGVVFRRGRYLVQILAGAQHSAVSASSVLALARLQDQRINSAG